ncbi:MAG: class I SAM-dependent methyltransferase [Myxococcales bacterium]|nr:class I SAM-dependent methyltransferase [Myxococcales bacterium]MCB9717500.1 class I SAM-dependent methyltransferase [Myxococcales bacterium]
MAEADPITRHYETCSEEGRLLKSRVRRLELETTLHLLDRHLAGDARLLELGAGHGAYSLRYARRGHRVLATDLVELNVRAIEEHARREGLRTLEARRLDAVSLRGLENATFDAVLCLGPYYHLHRRDDRLRCLLECRRVVREGGIVALSYINRAFAVPYLLTRGEPLGPEHYALLDADDRPPGRFQDEFFDIASFSRPAAVEEEARACGLAVIEHAGTDGVFGFFPEALERVSDELLAGYRAHHLATCSRPEHRATSPHCLVILERARSTVAHSSSK